MAEVVATFGALSSFIQLLEFGVKVTKHARKITWSEANAGSYDRETEQLTAEYKSLTKQSSTSVEDKEAETPDSIARIQQKLHNEAQELLKQLEALRVTPDTRGVKRFTEGARKAIRSVNDRKKLEQRRLHLQELNAILATHLLQLLITKHETQVKDAFMHLNLNVQGTSTYAKPTDHLLSLARAQNDGLKERHEALLRKLWFDEARHREITILEAYPNTYQWAVETESFGLKPWLERDSGIFWVCGKAGSGKSTLMKFLCQSSAVRNSIQRWSECYPFVFASFFFWFPGTALEKSLNGLLRAILYQVLSTRLDLAPIAFPSHYKSIVFSEHESGSDWTYSQLLEALENIGRCRETNSKRVKFCFFVDGLDEYDGNHLELVRTLQHLVKNPDVKLAVSSRPWNAFRKAFEHDVPSLRLEDLTSEDVHHYVSGSIREAYCSISSKEITAVEGGQESPGENTLRDDALALVEDIVTKAEGVFLWVHLVVKSVVSGIAEGDDIEFLRHRVQSFPSDLDDFFRSILIRVDAVYKAQTSQALYLAYLGVSKSWLDFWLIRQSPQGLTNPSFPFELAIEGLSVESLEMRISETRTFLSAVCKDLLWLPKAEDIRQYYPMDCSPADPPIIRVEYLHRSVYDFLKADNIQAMLKSHVPAHFDDGQIFHQLNLARLKLAILWSGAQGKHMWLQQTARESLTQPHPALNRTFVQAFEEVLLRYYWTYGKFGHSTVSLSAFVAFDCTQYIELVLMNSMKNSETHLTSNRVLVAAIGQSPLNKFSLEQTDLKLVESILDAGQKQECCKDGWQPASSRSTFLAGNLLPTLLISLAQEVSGTECNNSGSSLDLTVSYHALLVTKLLLLHAYPLTKIGLSSWISRSVRIHNLAAMDPTNISGSGPICFSGRTSGLSSAMSSKKSKSVTSSSVIGSANMIGISKMTRTSNGALVT